MTTLNHLYRHILDLLSDKNIIYGQLNKRQNKFIACELLYRSCQENRELWYDLARDVQAHTPEYIEHLEEEIEEVVSKLYEDILQDKVEIPDPDLEVVRDQKRSFDTATAYFGTLTAVFRNAEKYSNGITKKGH